jgi:ABC-type uncharacterized transport system substrate-binding protein
MQQSRERPVRAHLLVWSRHRGEEVEVRRREFIWILGGAAAASPLGVCAQEKRRIPRIGVLWHAANVEEEGPLFPALLEGFRDQGYVGGRNVILEHRFPNEMPERFTRMAAELVSLNVDVLVSVGNNAAPYAKNATATIPLVFILVADPVGTKLVESLAQPGGNATGIANFSAELIGKRLEILKEIVPGLSRVAQLVNPNAKISRLYIDLTQTAAGRLGLAVQTFEARSPDELAPAIEAMTRAGMQAVLTNADGLSYAQRDLIAELALKAGLPAAVFSRETLAPGALVSYGADNISICRRAAVFVDKILKGARPSDLPVEQATKFEFLINLKTAKALGLTVPPTLLARADEVIE